MKRSLRLLCCLAAGLLIGVFSVGCNKNPVVGSVPGIAPDASGASALSGISISPSTFLAAGKATITLTMTSRNGGIRYVSLKSSSAAVKVPTSCGVWTNDSSDVCNQQATISAVTSPQTVTVTATYNGVSKTATITLKGGSTPTASLSDSASSVAFGNVALNTPTTKQVTLTSTGTAPVTVTAVTASGTGFSASGGTGTLAPGATAIITISFDPTTAGAVTGAVTVTSNVPPLDIALSGTGVTTTAPPTLTIVSCTNAAITGAGTDTCQVDLSGPATAATAVALASSTGSLTVPASATVATGASSASFTATASAVTTTTTATITASLAGNKASTTIELEPATTTSYQVDLTWNASSGSPVPVTGYYVYRSISGGSYLLLTTSPVTGTAYTDTTVADGVTYGYEVTSGDAAGVQSGPSNIYTVSIQ